MLERGNSIPLTILLLVALTTQCLGQGYPAKEAASKMTVAPAFEVTLVASEPIVRQPVAIEFDDRGRLWVLQYLQYPNPAGLQRAKVDRFSRTLYDRVPEPPPKGPPGSDCVTILADKDGDGQFESSHDFVKGLNLTTGIAFGHGGVFLLQVPYLLFYPDMDENDVPDADPEVLLTGFGMEDAHSVANSLTWGPDGWLYGCQGSTVTASIRGIEFQQGVWRYHPSTKVFELFCEGGGNSWGLDFDPHGNLFYSTNNGPFCMLHGVQGGYYWKSFGKHGALHNPHTYGYFEHVFHENFRGGHVTVGGIIYQGDTFPSEFRGKYIGANLLSHDVYWHSLKEEGSSFRSKHAGELLLSNDTWFAPSDVTMGPDGAVYVADWHDARTAHPDPDAEWDRSNGRIYRIGSKDGPKREFRDLRKLPTAKLIDELGNTNDWSVRRARRLLADRQDQDAYAPLVAILEKKQKDQYSLEALWALYAAGGLSETLALALLDHPNEDVRWWTIRFLGDAKEEAPDVAMRLMECATRDLSLRVRSQLASSAKRLSAVNGLPIVAALIQRDDAKDLHLPQLLWWAIEDKAISDRDAVVRSFSTKEIWRTHLGSEEILPRLIRRYAAAGTDADFEACAHLLASAPSKEDRGRLLLGINAGLVGQTRTAIPDSLTALAKELVVVGDEAALTLALRLGSNEAIAKSLALAVNQKTPMEERRGILQVLSSRGEPGVVSLLMPLVKADQPEPDVALAMETLSRYSDPTIASHVLAIYPTLSASLKSRARDLLFGRAESSLAFLQQVDAGGISREDVPVEQLKPLAIHKTPSIDALVKKHWGSIQSATPEEVLAEIRRLNNDLRATAGDRKAGKAVFAKHCASCHQLFGEGNKIGPDLTTANRKDRDYLLTSLVDPGVVIRKEYLAYIVETNDGRILTGLIVEQTPTTLTLLDAKNQRINLQTAEVAALKESSVSLMPVNLYKELAPGELRNLFGYLQSEQP